MPDKKRRISLSEMTTGEEATVLGFQGGRMVSSRLASFGFTPGVQINMTQNYGRGPLIVTLRGTRVALGRGEAAKIIVERGSHE
jgi:ferrous iron transport protein A